MSSKQWMPVKRFQQIVREAETAYKKEDWEIIGRLNQELSTINTGIYWQDDGKSYLWTLSKNGAIPFDDIPEKSESD